MDSGHFDFGKPSFLTGSPRGLLHRQEKHTTPAEDARDSRQSGLGDEVGHLGQQRKTLCAQTLRENSPDGPEPN